MQSQRKNPGSYLTRQQSIQLRNSRSNTAHTKKLSVASQTENFPNFAKDLRLCNFSSMPIEEIKENYASTLSFLNCCHDFINTIFGETVGDLKLEQVFGFRVPEVPNYFSVLEMFLDKSRASITDQNGHKMDNLRLAKRNLDEHNLTDKNADDEQVIFDLQQFLPKNIGDGPIFLNSPRGLMRTGGIVEHVTKKSMFKNCENIKIDGLKKFGAWKRSSTTSPSRLVKSEKDIPKRPSRHELKALSTTFEEILKSCNEFEQKSKEHLFKNVTSIDEFYHSPRDKPVTIVMEKCHQGDQRTNQETIINNSLQNLTKEGGSIKRHQNNDDTSTNIKDSFNLIEYALKNLRDSEYESDSPQSLISPKGRVASDIVPMVPSQGVLSEIFPDSVLFNFPDASVAKKKSWTVLNEACQTQSPKKVNEMFQKLSRENLRSSDKGESSCDFNDSDTFIKFIDNDSFSDEYDREYTSGVFIENCRKDREGTGDVKMTSSSDSIILTDEEFERKNRNNCMIWSQEVSPKKEQQYKHESNIKDFVSAQKTPHKPVKSHPLKLTDKDRSLADQQVLKTIGLFTDKGDFRPGVINILQEKQRTNFTQNADKNVQFRRERKFDVRVQYNINNQIKLAETRASKESVNGKNLADQQTVSYPSIRSSAVTFSSSTISDSDLLSMEPNSTQTVIKKF